MLTRFFNLYLIFIIIASLLSALILLKNKKALSKKFLLPAITIIFLPALLGYIYLSYFSSLPEVTVPNLRGLSLEMALVKLEILGLKGQESGKVFTQQFSEGTVVKQRPLAGRKVKARRVISLITSSGEKIVYVPNLLGRPLSQIEQVLTANGLFLGEKKTEAVKDFQAGLVLSQDPVPNTEVETGSLINVTVSASLEEEKKKERGFFLW